MVAGGLAGPNEAAEPEVRMRDDSRSSEDKRGRGRGGGEGGDEKKKKKKNRPPPDNGREIIISTIGFEPMT